MNLSKLIRVAESYIPTLIEGNPDALVELVGGDGIIEDPRFPSNVGESEVRTFVENYQKFVTGMSPSTEHLRTTATDNRVLSEDILHIDNEGERWELPVGTVVAIDPDNAAIRVHVYYTNWPFNKKHTIRRNLFNERVPDQAEFEGAIMNYVQCLLSGNLEKMRESFEADIYFREASGLPYLHWGRNAVVDYFRGLFAEGAPILRDDTVTDDGRTVFMEFTVVGWDGKERPLDRWEAGLAVYERSRDGLMAAIRIYDDVDFG